MGCDIHMIAEERSKYRDANPDCWLPMLAPIFKVDDYDESEGMTRYNHPYTFQPYDDRNYEVFAVLANQRNHHEPEIKPISEPRGYPVDIHPVSTWLLDGYDFVDHSPTWLSLDEVFAYDWSQPSPRYLIGGTLADSASRFLEHMEQLKAYAQAENVDIRLVFGFDN